MIDEKFCIDTRFYKYNGPFKISEIAQIIGAETPESYEDKVINYIKPLNQAERGDLSFLIINQYLKELSGKYLQQLKETKASVCIIPKEISIIENEDIIFLKADNSHLAYTKAINLFYDSKKSYSAEIMPSAFIANSARIGKNCYIGHGTFIDDEVEIGDNCVIESGCHIGRGVKIGNNAMIYANVTITYAIIDDNAVILTGARIGQDGFGFSTDRGIHHKIYHIGRVIIGKDVEIGANTTIDRGSVNDTIIEDGVRIDNLVQLGHSVIIGKGSIIVAQVGIAGSSKVGAYCALGGQVGVAGHVKIGDKAQIVAQSGIMKDIEDGQVVAGTPSMPVKDWHRQTIMMKKLIKNK